MSTLSESVYFYKVCGDHSHQQWRPLARLPLHQGSNWTRRLLPGWRGASAGKTICMKYVSTHAYPAGLCGGLHRQQLHEHHHRGPDQGAALRRDCRLTVSRCRAAAVTTAPPSTMPRACGRWRRRSSRGGCATAGRSSRRGTAAPPPPPSWGSGPRSPPTTASTSLMSGRSSRMRWEEWETVAAKSIKLN